MDINSFSIKFLYLTIESLKRHFPTDILTGMAGETSQVIMLKISTSSYQLVIG